MDYFDEKKELDSASIVEHIFGEFEINNILNYVYCKLSKNGGLFLITQNFKLKEEVFFKRDPELKNNVKIFNSDGTFLNKIPISDFIVEIDFLENEKIIVIDSFGKYKIYNPYCEITNENYLENSLPKNLEKIKLAKYKKNCIFFITENFNLYLMVDLDKPVKYLLSNDKNLIPENLEEDFLDFFYNKNNNNFIFFLSCRERGLLIITFNKDEKKLEKKFILNEKKIIKVILAPSKKMLAYLTSEYELIITDLKFRNKKNIILNFTETEKNQLKIKWISNSGVVIKTNSKINFILSDKIIKKNFDSGINTEKNLLILESEIDGIRILKIKKITSTRYFCENILIRKICPFYENVKNIISFSPGNNLYTSYKSFLKELPPKQKDIINNPLELIKGIKEIIFSIKFEINEKKQKKFLKCLNFGKLFINGNDKIDKNIIFDLCNNIKSWINIKFCNNRYISFLQFEYLLKNKFNDFISILINSENFYFAFYLSILKNNPNLIKKIFLSYTESLLKKNLSDKKISENILNSFNYIKKSIKNFDSAILINIANKCYEKNRYSISEELLKYDNPIILKITSFLKMKQYYKALEQALLINDSNALYLIFYKIFQISDIEKKKLFNQNIINSKNQILIDHYHHFLEIEKNMFFNHFCNLIKNPNDFYIKNNYRIFYINNINKALNFIQTNIELLEDTKSLFKKNKKDYIFGHILTFYKILENDLKSSNFINYDISIFKNLNSYNILLPYFLKEKHNYLYNPNFEFSREILDICKKLNISIKLLFLKRINFMINNLEEKDFFQIIKFIQIHQKKFSVIQLHMFFFNLKKSDFFLKILEIFHFGNTYDLLFDKQLFYESAYLAQFNNNQPKFMESFGLIQSAKQKKELQDITRGKFK